MEEHKRIIQENFPELKSGVSQIERTHQILDKIDHRPTSTHAIVKPKITVISISRSRRKDGVLGGEDHMVHTERSGSRMASKFSMAILKARRQWSNNFKIMEEISNF